MYNTSLFTKKVNYHSDVLIDRLILSPTPASRRTHSICFAVCLPVDLYFLLSLMLQFEGLFAVNLSNIVIYYYLLTYRDFNVNSDKLAYLLKYSWLFIFMFLFTEEFE